MLNSVPSPPVSWGFCEDEEDEDEEEGVEDGDDDGEDGEGEGVEVVDANFWRPGNFQPGIPRHSVSLYRQPNNSLLLTASCGRNRGVVSTKRYLGQTGD